MRNYIVKNINIESVGQHILATLKRDDTTIYVDYNARTHYAILYAIINSKHWYAHQIYEYHQTLSVDSIVAVWERLVQRLVQRLSNDRLMEPDRRRQIEVSQAYTLLNRILNES